jgi:hypothetical protein
MGLAAPVHVLALDEVLIAVLTLLLFLLRVLLLPILLSFLPKLVVLLLKVFAELLFGGELFLYSVSVIN